MLLVFREKVEDGRKGAFTGYKALPEWMPVYQPKPAVWGLIREDHSWEKGFKYRPKLLDPSILQLGRMMLCYVVQGLVPPKDVGKGDGRWKRRYYQPWEPGFVEQIYSKTRTNSACSTIDFLILDGEKEINLIVISSCLASSVHSYSQVRDSGRLLFLLPFFSFLYLVDTIY